MHKLLLYVRVIPKSNVVVAVVLVGELWFWKDIYSGTAKILCMWIWDVLVRDVRLS